MTSTAIFLVILVLTSLVKGSPLGCNVLHRVVYGCKGLGGRSIEHCLDVGMTPFDLNYQIDADDFEKRIQESANNQESYYTYLREVKACADKGTFRANLECEYSSARILAKALGCLN